MRRLFAITFALLIALSSTAAYAQFEGQVTINLFSYENGQPEVSELNLYATKDRIMIKGEENLELMGGVSSGGLLIRNDMKDFIIMTENNKALQATKSGIESMVEMMTSWAGDSDSDSDGPDVNYSFTDRTKNVNGLETIEMIVKDAENPNKHLSVWVTPDIDIDWGMLAEPWRGMPKSMDKELNGMSQEIFFKGKNFPMLVESVEGDERTKVMEVKNVNRSSLAKAMVEVPSGVTLISLQEFIFNMMME